MRSTTLYEDLLGAAWNDVDRRVRAAHRPGRELRGRGVFRITNGTGTVARALARLLRMPMAAPRERVELVITRNGNGELWSRSFGDRRLVTRQSATADGRLSERIGCLEFRFALEVTEGAIRYRQERVSLCLGPVSVGIPRRLGPRVAAVERRADGDLASAVAVEVSLPMAGLLVSYEGILEMEG